MGIVNVTPDSFSDGGLHATTAAAVGHALRLSEDGADIVDVGGESTRPGADPVPVAEEIDRVVPVVARLASEGLVVSVDTMKPEVASAAIEAGAAIVNDVGGLADPEMRRLVADSGAGVVVMHMQGTPRTMQDDPRYVDVVSEVRDFFDRRVGLAVAAGVDRAAIVVDPGIGFGKTVDHNLTLLSHLGELSSLPVMVGVSRKRFLGTLTGRDRPQDRDSASAAAAAVAVARGASVVRTHDVASTLEAVKVAWAIVRGTGARRAPVVGEGVVERW